MQRKWGETYISFVKIDFAPIGVIFFLQIIYIKRYFEYLPSLSVRHSHWAFWIVRFPKNIFLNYDSRSDLIAIAFYEICFNGSTTALTSLCFNKANNKTKLNEQAELSTCIYETQQNRTIKYNFVNRGSNKDRINILEEATGGSVISMSRFNRDFIARNSWTKGIYQPLNAVKPIGILGQALPTDIRAIRIKISFWGVDIIIEMAF